MVSVFPKACPLFLELASLGDSTTLNSATDSLHTRHSRRGPPGPQQFQLGDGPRTSGATPTTSEAGLRGIVGPEPETTTPSRHGLPPQWLYPRLPARWNEIVPEDGETLELKMPEIQRDRDQPSVRNKKNPPMMALPDPPCVSNHRLGHLLSLDARRHRRWRCANTALGTNNPPTWSGP